MIWHCIHHFLFTFRWGKKGAPLYYITVLHCCTTLHFYVELHHCATMLPIYVVNLERNSLLFSTGEQYSSIFSYGIELIVMSYTSSTDVYWYVVLWMVWYARLHGHSAICSARISIPIYFFRGIQLSKDRIRSKRTRNIYW